MNDVKAPKPFTEILPNDDPEAGVHRQDFANAISVWSFMQNKETLASVAEVALAFNTTPELVRQAVEDHYWLFLECAPGETDPTKQLIWHEGE